MSEEKPAPRSDFSKVMQRQWQEEQLQLEVAELKEQVKKKDQKIEAMQAEKLKLGEKAVKMQEAYEKQLKEWKAKHAQVHKDLDQKEEELRRLRKEVNVLKAALEEEQNKGLFARVFRK